VGMHAEVYEKGVSQVKLMSL